MADKKLDRQVEEAAKAYQRKDKRKGAQLLDEVLRKDFNHPGAWDLMYRLFGGGRDFADFQRAFALQYYPDRLNELQPGRRPDIPTPEIEMTQPETPGSFSVPVEPEEPEKKSFFARLFGGLFRRKKKEAQPAAPVAPPPPAPAASSTNGGMDSANAPISPAIGTPSSPVVRRALTSAAPPPSKPASSILPASPPPAEAAPARPAAPQPAPAAIIRPAAPRSPNDRKIHVIVVDDIPQTRETIIRTLRFQDNIEVDGTATNGVQAIALVKELRPDVVIMDVNMPDMDGITATGIIKREVPYAQVIILTVQDDVDYIRQAMNAGARDFLAKPPMIEDLMTAITRAAEFARRERENAPPPVSGMGSTPAIAAAHAGRGKIITVYSPRGGSGCTTLSCNLGAALYNPENQVVVVDGNLQFGDVAVYFNVQPKNDITDLAPRVEELDLDLVNEVLTSHPSGIRVLPPSRPERSELVTGQQFSQLLVFLSTHYPYVIVDAPHRLNDVALAALDISDVIILVATQDIPSISRMRKFLDLVPQLNINPKRLMVVMNQFDQRISIDPEKLGQAFNQPVVAIVPAAKDIAMAATNRGEPFMLTKDIATRPIGRGVLNIVEALRQRLAQVEQLSYTQSK